MTRRGRSPSVKCAVGSSCTSLHSPDNPQGTLPCDYLPLSSNHQAKPHSSISYRPTDAFGDGFSRPIGLNMEVKHARDNESLLYSKQPSPRENPRFPPRIEKKDMPSLHQKLWEADKMERVRAETRARISKAIKVRDGVLSHKPQQAKEDDAERATGLPRKEGPSMTKEPKIEWTPVQPWALEWDRTDPLSLKQQADGGAGRAMALPRQGPSVTKEPKKNEWTPPQPWALNWDWNDALSHKQQAEGDTEQAMAFPRKEGPSMMTKEPKKIEWSPPRPWALNWDRSSPRACPMKLPWNNHCLCYDCLSPRPWGAGLFAPGALLAKPAISSPKEPWRLDKKAVDAGSAKPTKVLDTEANRPGSVVKREVTKSGLGEVINPGLKEVVNPGLKNPMRHAPTANNSADSLPQMARVAANPSPAAQQTKQEEKERKAATPKDAVPPPTNDHSNEDSVAGGRVWDTMCSERRKEVLRKIAGENKEWMESRPLFQYQSIKRPDVQELKDELNEANDKLAIIKEVMQQDQAGLKNLLDALRRGEKKTCTQQDETINGDVVAVPASSKKVDSQAPAQTGTDSTESGQRDEETSKTPLSFLITKWNREIESLKTAQTQPCSTTITPNLLLAVSISDLTLRLIMLVAFWCCSPAAWWPSFTIQTTIVWLTPAAMILACWRTWVAQSLTVRGDESEWVVGVVEKIDLAALGVGALLFVSFVAEVVVFLQ